MRFVPDRSMTARERLAVYRKSMLDLIFNEENPPRHVVTKVRRRKDGTVRATYINRGHKTHLTFSAEQWPEGGEPKAGDEVQVMAYFTRTVASITIGSDIDTYTINGETKETSVALDPDPLEEK